MEEKGVSKLEKGREKFLYSAYTKHRKKFDKIIRFMKQNNRYAKKYRENYLNSIINGQDSFKEKIRKLFVHDINAAGGNNLSSTGTSCKKFYKIIDKFPNEKKIKLTSFFNKLGSGSEDFDGIFKFLVKKKKFKNFNKKKVALFIRNIHIINKKLFIDYSIRKRKNELKIPVDVVIVSTLNNILCLKGKNKLKPTRDSDFILINKFAKDKLKNDYMLIEDLWFWGYFNSKTIKSKTKKGKTKKDKRKFIFNEDKYYSNPHTYPNKELRSKLIKFKKLLN